MADKIRNIEDARRQNRNKKSKLNNSSANNGRLDDNRQKRMKKRTIVSVIGLVIWFVILIILAWAFGKFYGFLNTFSDLLMNFAGQISAGIIASIVAAFLAANKMGWPKVWTIVSAFCFIMAIILCISSIKLITMEKDKKTKEEPAAAQVEQTEQAPQDEQSEQSETRTVYEVRRYSLKDDPFIIEIEAYCGVEKGAIEEEEASQKRAELILEDIETERRARKEREVPQSFYENRDIADFQYGTYVDQLKRADMVERETVRSTIKKIRLDVLKDAKEHRIKADEQYKDPENQRHIALYCIDLCDEYLRDGDINSAWENAEEGAQWAVWSIYNAMIKGNADAMNEGYQVLEDLVKRLEEMSGQISGEVIENVQNCRNAYRIVLQNMK